MSTGRRTFFGLLLRAGKEAVQTLVHEGLAGAGERLEVVSERAAAAPPPPAGAPVAAPAPPFTLRPTVWAGLPARGCAQALAPDLYDLVGPADVPDLPGRVAAGHLALLPLNTGAALSAGGMELYLLGVAGPEPAALVSAGGAVRSWLDLMWTWAAVAADHPALYPLAYRLSGGDAYRLTGCFGVLPETQILDLLRAGRLQAAVLTGGALGTALTLPGVQVAVDLAAEAAAALPGAPWAPLTGLFATGEALRRAPEAVGALVDAYAAALRQGDNPMEYVPAEVCQPWVEALLEQQVLRRPSASPAEERWGE